MHAFNLFVTVLLTFSKFTFAQTALQLAGMIPACTGSCDAAALASNGCARTDFACHCAHGADLEQIIVPCLTASSNCTAADIKLFVTLATEICEVVAGNGTSVNSTASVTTGSISVTSTPTATQPTVATYTGGAASNGYSAGLLGLLGLGIAGLV